MTVLRTALLLTAVWICAAAENATQPPKLRLAEVQSVAPTRYRADLSLSPAKDDFTGTITIDLDVKKPLRTLWLNANQIQVTDAKLTSGGKQLTATTIPGGNDFAGFSFPTDVSEGSAQIVIEYSGTIRHGSSAGAFSMEDSGNRYIFTQFESTDARDVFPCFDEPSYKVPWQLILHVPSGDKAINNAPIANESTKNGTTTYTFKETKPLPSYLVAFAVGPFEFVDAGTAGRNHIPVRIVTPKGKANEAKYAAEVSATVLARLEDYFGVPYPYEKSDQVAVPVTFGFGAMENAGMVTYAQTLILARPESDTIQRQRGYASVAAHELAHQWFGDLVTTAWWNDIWLNEAFATWMQQKLIAEWKPEWNTRVSQVNRKLGAENEDSLISARKIRQEIESKDDISNAFDGITYVKGAAVIGMFESWIGPQDFQKGIRGYMKQYAFKNATAGDFLDSLSSASKRDVTQAFSTFLNQPGVPLLTVTLDCKQGRPALHLEQQRSLPLGSKGTGNEQWSIPVCVRYPNDGSPRSECKLIGNRIEDWTLDTKTCPAWVQANSRAAGYYRVNYQGTLLADLTKGDVKQRLSAAERVDLMGNAEALSAEGKFPAADALSLVETFHADPERQVVQTALAIALAPREYMVPPNLLPNYQRFLLRNFQGRAHELGWIPKAGESEEMKLLRPELLRVVATYGGDQELAAQAKDLTPKWFENRAAISPEMTAAVLETAAYYGDKSLWDHSLAEYKKSKDRQEQQRIRAAMGSFRDRASIEAGFDAVLSGEIPFIEGAQLLFAGQGEQATRALAFDFLKTHFDEISKKRPQGGGFDFGARLPAVGASYCDTNRKQELQTFFQSRIAQFTGGPRSLAQTLERIDVCIAQKAAQEPSVIAFLQKY